MLGEDEFQTLTATQEIDGQRVSGLKFGDETVLAILTALLMFRYLPEGFRNRDLRSELSHLLPGSANEMTAGRMTYQLRRLRLRGLIRRIPKTQRYEVTAEVTAPHCSIWEVFRRPFVRWRLSFQPATPSNNCSSACAESFKPFNQQP